MMMQEVVLGRVEKCESVIKREMEERIECLKKIAYELVNTKEQQDRMNESINMMQLDQKKLFNTNSDLTNTLENVRIA